jgi:hypothetical protein
MKRVIFIFLLLTVVEGQSQANQNLYFDDWFVTVGLNAVNSLGTLNPIYKPGKWAFKTPFAISGEKQLDRDWNFELAMNLNGVNEGQDFDPGAPPRDLTYFSVDALAKWYFGRQIFRRGYDRIDFYATAGLGFFTIDKANGSVNFGGGVLFWLDENNTFGLRLQCIGKFAFNNRDSGYDNNHYQWGLHGVWRLPY